MACTTLILIVTAACAQVAWTDPLSNEQKADLPKFVNFWKANCCLKFKPGDTLRGFEEEADFKPLAVVSADANSVKISVTAMYKTTENLAIGAHPRAVYPKEILNDEITVKAEATLVVTSKAGKFAVARDTATQEKILAQDKPVSATAEATKYTALKTASVEQLAKTLEQFLNEPKDSKAWDGPLLAAETPRDEPVSIQPNTLKALKTFVNNQAFFARKNNQPAGFTIDKEKLKGFRDHGQFRDFAVTETNKLQFTAWFFADNTKGSRAAYPPQLAADDAVLIITCNAVVTGSTKADFTATVDRATGVRAVRYWNAKEEGYAKRIPNMTDPKGKSLLDATIAEISHDMTNSLKEKRDSR